MRWRPVALVSGSSLVSSALALLVFLAAGRSLDPVSFADFAAIWGAIFGMAAVLGAVELEAARQTASGEDTGDLTRTAVAAGFVLAVLGLLGAPLLARVLRLSEPALVLALPAAAAVYPTLFAIRGRLAGSARLHEYATITPLENAVRLMVAIPPVFTGTARFVGAIAAGPLASVPWAKMALGPLRGSWSWAATWGQVGRVAPLLSGNLAGALLITGVPATAIIVLGTDDAVGISVAVALATISRIPLILLNSVYGLLVPWFVRRAGLPTRRRHARRSGVMLLAGAAAISSVVVFGVLTAVGAGFMIGAPERIGLGIALVYVAGAGCLGLLQISMARLVAAGRRALVQAMWWSAALTAIGAMIVGRVTDSDVIHALAIALLVGPLVGLVVTVAHQWRAREPRDDAGAPQGPPA